MFKFFLIFYLLWRFYFGLCAIFGLWNEEHGYCMKTESIVCELCVVFLCEFCLSVGRFVFWYFFGLCCFVLCCFIGLCWSMLSVVFLVFFVFCNLDFNKKFKCILYFICFYILFWVVRDFRVVKWGTRVLCEDGEYCLFVGCVWVVCEFCRSIGRVVCIGGDWVWVVTCVLFVGFRFLNRLDFNKKFKYFIFYILFVGFDFN
jgi:hypothetical protein